MLIWLIGLQCINFITNCHYAHMCTAAIKKRRRYQIYRSVDDYTFLSSWAGFFYFWEKILLYLKPGILLLQACWLCWSISLVYQIPHRKRFSFSWYTCTELNVHTLARFCSPRLLVCRILLYMYVLNNHNYIEIFYNF